MSVYFDPRVKKQEAEDKEAEKQEAIQTIARAIGFFVKPVILMLLWNWLMPGLFGLATIGYLKALALTMISRILFSNDD
jgi:hypothetical protein|tara:strand:+ start:5202 stop:5438 length:237 start_codon:yes stop_codon:yes gene_type:complete